MPSPPPVGLSPYRTAAPLTAAEERALKPRDAFKECLDCPEMVVVPAGSFMMGSPAWEEGREFYDKGSEGPQRRVSIARSFAVGKLEVTFDEWDACVAEGGCSHRPHDAFPGERGWGRGRRPVINVSWSDVTRQYLPWLSRKTGKAYRLLTDAEWEYAARAGTTTRYAFGDTIGPSQAQFGANMTVPVGSFQPNAFGLYDMHGNVWEWVQDCWNDSHIGAPSDGSALTTGLCNRRVLRGGAWYLASRDLRSALRYWLTFDYRDNFLGFRVARAF